MTDPQAAAIAAADTTIYATVVTATSLQAGAKILFQIAWLEP